jgi:hypothetical protein
MSRILILALLLTTLLTTHAPADDPPPRYLFYLHGQIVEGSDGRPEHPTFGVYDYPAIIEALETEGFTVISEIRKSDTDGRQYAEHLATEIQILLTNGIPANRISIVGASKGGAIAVAASSILENRDLNFVFMGTCVNWIQNWPELELRGRILSIAEKSDTVAGSCTEPFAKSDIQPEFHEIVINTGRNHGAFFEPISEWLEPTVAWCRVERR